MSLNSGKLRFHGFVLDAHEGVLTKDGSHVPLPPKALKLLSILIANRGRIVEKDELMEEVWGDTFVEEGNLAYTIRLLRKTLGDDAASPRFIENIPRRGYRFIADVTSEETEPLEVFGSKNEGVPSIPVVYSSPQTALALAPEEPEAQSGDSPPAGSVLKFPTVVGARQTAETPDNSRRSDIRKLIGYFAGAAVLIGTLAIVYYFVFQKNVSTGDKRSIAVLPFTNESGNSDLEYLSDGISESLINSFSELKQLKVIARSTAFRYKDKQTDPGEVGRRLEVDTVLTGKVTLLGDNLVVQADLIDVASGAQIWGERYTKKLADLLKVQQDISREIVGRLQPRLNRDAQTQFAELQTNSSKAYELYLKASFFRHRRIDSELRRSIAYAEQAIAEDPRYALAYSSMADSYNVMGFYAYLSPIDAFPKARDAAKKALEFNPGLAEGHNSLAYVSLYYDWDLAEAERGFLRAIELKSNYAVAHQWYGNLLTAAGRWEEAIKEFERAREIDPVSPVINAVPGWTYYYAREYDKAIAPCQRALELEPTFPIGHVWLGQAYERKGLYENAIAEFKEAIAHSQGAPEATALLAHAYAVSGEQDQAKKTLAELIALGKEKYVSPYHIATVYAGLGERDLAFKWLETAYEDRQNVMVFLRHDSRLDVLHQDPRFQDLMKRIGTS